MATDSPPEDSTVITTRVDCELADEFRRAVVLEDRSVAAAIRRLMREEVRRHAAPRVAA